MAVAASCPVIFVVHSCVLSLFWTKASLCVHHLPVLQGALLFVTESVLQGVAELGSNMLVKDIGVTLH